MQFLTCTVFYNAIKYLCHFLKENLNSHYCHHDIVSCIQGPPGQRGERGLRGPPGNNGCDGADGISGAAGEVRFSLFPTHLSLSLSLSSLHNISPLQIQLVPLERITYKELDPKQQAIGEPGDPGPRAALAHQERRD